MSNNSTAPYVTWYVTPVSPRVAPFYGFFVTREWNGQRERTHYAETRGQAQAIVEFLSGRRDTSPLATQKEGTR